MNINRNNYEEYFLLYADNELLQTEKNEVEKFIKENGDLEEEFNMIKFTINVPDENVGMPDKSFLMKNELSSFINETNYKEEFILYHDNELSDEQRKAVEEFVKQHPQLNIEFELIGKAQLIADEHIVFPDKNQLYRKEKVGKVISLILWRSAAAAVFIGFGLWVAVSYFDEKEGTRAIALDGKTIKSLSTNRQNIIDEKPAGTENIAASSITKKEITKKENEEIILKENKLKQTKNEIAKTVAKKEIKINPIPEEKLIRIKQENGKQLIAANIPVKNNSDKIEGTKAPISTNGLAEHIDKYDENMQSEAQAQNTSYAIDNNSNDENYVFYNVKADEFNKSKIGGFLKKVKRIVERTNPIARLLSGEDKQVASK